MKAIIGKKVGMSQIFDEMGKVILSPLSRQVPASSFRRRLSRRTATTLCSWVLRMFPRSV